MNDTPQRPPLPDRLSVDPRSPHHVTAVLEHDVGIRLNDTERRDVEEYCARLIKACGRGGGFILSAGSSIDEARPENIKAMLESPKKHVP